MASLRDRFFVEGVHAIGESVTFAADDARKIATVLRGRSGDRADLALVLDHPQALDETSSSDQLDG